MNKFERGSGAEGYEPLPDSYVDGVPSASLRGYLLLFKGKVLDQYSQWPVHTTYFSYEKRFYRHLNLTSEQAMRFFSTVNKREIISPLYFERKSSGREWTMKGYDQKRVLLLAALKWMALGVERDNVNMKGLDWPMIVNDLRTELGEHELASLLQDPKDVDVQHAFRAVVRPSTPQNQNIPTEQRPASEGSKSREELNRLARNNRIRKKIPQLTDTSFVATFTPSQVFDLTLKLTEKNFEGVRLTDNVWVASNQKAVHTSVAAAILFVIAAQRGQVEHFNSDLSQLTNRDLQQAINDYLTITRGIAREMRMQRPDISSAELDRRLNLRNVFILFQKATLEDLDTQK